MSSLQLKKSLKKTISPVQKKEANLFLNGTFTDYSGKLNSEIYTIAADGGAENALKNNLVPNAIIGDRDSFDALPAQIKTQLKRVSYIDAQDQDYTDFEKAMKFLLKEGFIKVNVYCFQGNRIDHMLAGLSVVAELKDMEIVLFTSNQRIQKLAYKNKLKLTKETVLSLIPYPYAQNVTSTGLYWDLTGTNFELGAFLSISNKVKSREVSIEYTRGNLYLVI